MPQSVELVDVEMKLKCVDFVNAFSRAMNDDQQTLDFLILGGNANCLSLIGVQMWYAVFPDFARILAKSNFLISFSQSIPAS